MTSLSSESHTGYTVPSIASTPQSLPSSNGPTIRAKKSKGMALVARRSDEPMIEAVEISDTEIIDDSSDDDGHTTRVTIPQRSRKRRSPRNAAANAASSLDNQASSSHLPRLRDTSRTLRTTISTPRTITPYDPDAANAALGELEAAVDAANAESTSEFREREFVDEDFSRPYIEKLEMANYEIKQYREETRIVMEQRDNLNDRLRVAGLQEEEIASRVDQEISDLNDQAQVAYRAFCQSEMSGVAAHRNLVQQELSEANLKTQAVVTEAAMNARQQLSKATSEVDQKYLQEHERMNQALSASLKTQQMHYESLLTFERQQANEYKLALDGAKQREKELVIAFNKTKENNELMLKSKEKEFAKVLAKEIEVARLASLEESKKASAQEVQELKNQSTIRVGLLHDTVREQLALLHASHAEIERLKTHIGHMASLPPPETVFHTPPETPAQASLVNEPQASSSGLPGGASNAANAALEAPPPPQRGRNASPRPQSRGRSRPRGNDDDDYDGDGEGDWDGWYGEEDWEEEVQEEQDPVLSESNSESESPPSEAGQAERARPKRKAKARPKPPSGTSQERRHRREMSSSDGSSDSNCGSKEKEHTSIEVRQLPEWPQFEAWKMSLLESVRACANRADPRGITKWFLACYDLSFDELRECPRKYMRMDGKLSNALNKILKGQLSRTVNIRKQEALRSYGDDLLRGRQIYKLILESYRTGPKLGRYFSTLDLEKLEWKGDSIEQIQQFRSNIEDLEANLNPSVVDEERLEVFLNRMEKSKVLELKLDKFKEYRVGGTRRTKANLLKIIDNHIDMHITKENQKKKSDAFAGRLNGRKDRQEHGKSAFVVKSQSVCQAYLRGQCTKTKKDCSYAHPDGMEGIAITSQKGGGKGKDGGKGKSKGKDKGKGKGKSKGTKRSDSPNALTSEQKSRIYCKHLLAGKCEYGKNCNFSHDPKDKPNKKAYVGKAEEGSDAANAASDADSTASKSRSARRREKAKQKKAEEAKEEEKKSKKKKKEKP